MKTYSAWHSLIKHCLKKHGITHPQFVVLATLAYLLEKENEVTQIMLSQQANIDVMTISQILENLEKKAFIERRISAKDSRAKSIKLTEKGYNVVDITVPQVEMVDEQFFSRLNTDINIFRNMLKILINS